MRNRPDKRIFSRLKTHTFSIEYKVNDTNSVYKADVLNISAGGVCFLRSSILGRGDTIQIKFQFHSKKIVLNGQIIRIEGREVAVKFVDDENKIEKFVEYFNSEFWKVRGKSDAIRLKDYFGDNERESEAGNLDLDH